MKSDIQLIPYDDLPCVLQMEITSYCNLKCKMCPLGTGTTLSSRQPGHITQAVWKEIIPVAGKIGKVTIAGYGEPLINRQCVPLLRELNSLDIHTGIATNGIALTRKVAAELVSLPHLRHINISIDSPDAGIYRDMRGGNVEKALRGLENLMAVIDNPDRVTVSSVLMHKNIRSLEAFPPILSRLGVKRYCLQGLIDHNPDLHCENLLYYEEISPSLDNLKEACHRAGIELLFSLPQRLDLEVREPLQARSHYFTHAPSFGPETKQCFVPWEIPFIDKDGRVFPCCNASTDPAWIMGDLRKRSLIDIWQGTVYRKFRQDLLDGRTIPAICQNCTTVPLGEHPLRLYSAKILFEESELRDQSEMCLVVQNTGICSWTQDTPILIGTTNPRDRVSAYFHPGWLSSNRIATFTEKIVPPGGTATFTFQITPVHNTPTEVFQLVVPGKCWLPDTGFEIRVGKAKEDQSVIPEKTWFPQFLKEKIGKWRNKIGKRVTPLGDRWLRIYSAKVLLEKSMLHNQSEMCLVVQNTGECYWIQETQILIGTTHPRDRESEYFHSSWLSPTRIATFTEKSIPPGGIATFTFQITPVPDAPTEVFQLVVEGKCWIPGTLFEICSKT
jgi:radical SAM protein with 4Fe4S-binding SPASM domain